MKQPLRMSKVLLLLLIIPILAEAQPDSLWSRIYGGGRGERCNSILQVADGGFLLGCNTQSFGAGTSDFWLLRTDEDGDSLWSRSFGGGDLEFCRSIIQTADGKIALAGTTFSFGAGRFDFWLVLVDENGDSLWSRTYGGESDEDCYSIIQTAEGGFALAGNGGRGFLMVKVNERGDSLWSATFGGENVEYLSTVIQTTDGGYALAGTTNSFGAGLGDFRLVRTNARGDSLWSRTFGGRGNDICSSLIQTADGGFALAGTNNSLGASSGSWLVRTDEHGDELWSSTFGGSCYSLIQTADGGFALAGPTYHPVRGYDFFLAKSNEFGDSLWSRSFGTRLEEQCFSFVQTADSGFALAGHVRDLVQSTTHVWLLKTGPDPLTVPSSPFPFHASSFILHPAFPNPFNSSTNITYDVARPGFVRLGVYDAMGRLVGTVKERYAIPGTYREVWNGEGIVSGTYIFQISSESGEQFRQRATYIK